MSRRAGKSCGNPPARSAEDREARLDLMRRHRQGDPEARRQVLLEWLDMVLRLAACPRKRVARVAQKLLREVPQPVLEEHARQLEESDHAP